MSFSKPQVSFSSNFASLFSVMKDNSSVLRTKGTNQNQSGNFENFKCSSKIHRILSFLKQEISFSSNFASLFSVTHHSSVCSILFYLKFYILLTKGDYQSTNLGKFHVSSRKSEILHFDRFVLSKSNKFSA